MGTVTLEPFVFDMRESEEDRRARDAAAAAVQAVREGVDVPPAARIETGPARPSMDPGIISRSPFERPNLDPGIVLRPQPPAPDPRPAAERTEDPLNDWSAVGAEPYRGGDRAAAATVPEPAPAPPPSSQTAAGLGRALTSPATPPPAAPPETSPRAALAAKLRQRLGKPPAAPTEAAVDHTGADVADAVRRPLHAIGAALRAAAGQSTRPMRSYGDESRARERQQLLDRLRQRQAERQGQQADERMALSREEAQARRVDRERDDARAMQQLQSQNAYREALIDQGAARIEQGERRTAAAESSAESLVESRQLAAQMERDRRDPESTLSQQARARLERELDYMRQVTGTAPTVNPEGMSAVDVEAVERRLGVPRHAARRTRTTGGGGGASTSRGDVTELARQAGMSEVEINAYGTSRRDRERLRQEAILRTRRQGRTAGRDAGTQVPGWQFNDRGDPGLTAPEVRTIRNANAQARVLQGRIRNMLGLVNEVNSLQAAGARASVVSAAMGRARAEHEQIINALREVGNYGVPQEAELARMEALAPRLDSVEGLLSARNVYRGLGSSMSGRMDDYMSAYNLVRDRAAGQRPTGHGGRSPSTGGGMVTVTNGQRRIRIPAERWERQRQAIEADGYRLEGGRGGS